MPGSQHSPLSPRVAPPRRPAQLRSLEEAPLPTPQLRARSTELIVPVLLGVLLWSVVCWESISIELGASDTRLPQVLLLVQPLLVLGTGLLLRSSPFILVAFPMTLLLAAFGLDPLDLQPLGTLRGAFTLSGALLLFLFGVARYGPSRERRALLVGERLRTGLDARHHLLAFGTWTRGILLLALLIVPLHALYGEAGRARLLESFGDGQSDAAAFIHTVHLFVAVLASAMFFLSPHVNLKLDVQELRARLRDSHKPEQAKRAWRTIAILLALGIVAVAFFISIGQRAL